MNDLIYSQISVQESIEHKIQLNDSHTGIYLAKVTRELFKTHNTSSRQLISITTDNGRNILKMVRDVEQQLTEPSHVQLQVHHNESMITGMNKNLHHRFIKLQ